MGNSRVILSPGLHCLVTERKFPAYNNGNYEHHELVHKPNNILFPTIIEQITFMRNIIEETSMGYFLSKLMSIPGAGRISS